MAKKKTSGKPRKSKKPTFRVHVPFSNPDFLNLDLVLEALMECLKMNDLDAFRGVLWTHIMTVNKSKLAKKAKIGRRTLYDLGDPNKEFNPELSTLAAIIQALAA